jgi:glutathione S-transferase
MADIVLHYFPLYARGEAIRQMLKSKGVEFTDKHISYEHWPTELASGNYEFKHLPMLEIDGLKLVTSQACERYVAQKYGLLPEDPYELYLVESLIDLKNDQVAKFIQFRFVLKDEEALTDWMSTGLVEVLKLIEARLLANDASCRHFVGSSVTWADYSIFQFLHDTFYLPESIELRPLFEAATPKLKEFLTHFVEADANLEVWLVERPKFPL